jgi:flagellar FliJ protein
MAKHFPIKTLIGLAQDDVDAAAQRLGRAQREASEVQAQLDALVRYRDEYRAIGHAGRQHA